MLLTTVRKRQGITFAVGWLAYASTYFLRKPLGVIKADLEAELSFTKTQLGWLDTALLLPYAVMQMALGTVGDKFGPRKTFGICLICAGLSMGTFGLWSHFGLFAFLLLANGTAQAQCWPSCMKALGAWFPGKMRNTVFGVFGTCAFCGGVAGTGLSVYLQGKYSWRAVYLPPSIGVAVMGVLVLALFNLPEELQMEVPGKAQNVEDKQEPLLESESENGANVAAGLSILQIWKIPVVAEISVAMFCLKLVRYCMYMWLPMYLLHQLKYSKVQAGLFSTMFEVGGVAGCALIGLVIDRMFKGRAMLGTMSSILLSMLSLVLFFVTRSWGIGFNSAFMFFAGAFNSGPDVILGGSIPAELGELDNRKSASAVVGLVNGFGSLGTFLEGPIVGSVTSAWGWSHMFYLMIGLSLVGSLATFKASVVYAKTFSTHHVKPETNGSVA